MCAPVAAILPYLAIAGTIGGSLLQMQGQQQANDARDAAANANIAKQTEMRHQADSLFQASLARGQADTIKSDADAQAQKRAATLVPQTPADPLAASIVPGIADHASIATKNAVVDDTAKTTADLTRQGTGKSILAGNNDAFRRFATDTQPNADRIGQVAVDIQAQNNLLPLEMTAASRAGGGLRAFGGLLNGLGGAAAAGSGGIGGLFGGAASGSGGGMGVAPVNGSTLWGV